MDTDKWTAHVPLNSKKGSLGAVNIGDKLFAAGGGNGAESFSDVEMYDPDIGKWIPTRSMLHKVLMISFSYEACITIELMLWINVKVNQENRFPT